MCQTLCMPTLEIISWFFHFHLTVFPVWCCACSVKYLAAVGNWMCARCLCFVRVVHEGRGSGHAKNQTILSIFFPCGCVFWQKMTSSHTEAVMHEIEESATKDLLVPRQSLLLPNAPPFLVLLTNISLHTRVQVIGYFRKDHNTNSHSCWPLHRGWSILGFPVLLISDTINLIQE